MKVVTAAEMRQIDQDTIEGIGIPGIVLMETAGSAIVRAIEQYYPTCQRIGIFAGKGNNGGDGIVIARQLAHIGRDVRLLLVSPRDSFTGEAQTNLQIAKNLGLRIEELLTDAALGSDFFVERSTSLTHIASCELLVDAIFGTGLRGAVRDPIATVINAINRLSTPVLSVDLPSGLDADTGHSVRDMCSSGSNGNDRLAEKRVANASGCRTRWKTGRYRYRFPRTGCRRTKHQGQLDNGSHKRHNGYPRVHPLLIKGVMGVFLSSPVPQV